MKSKKLLAKLIYIDFLFRKLFVLVIKFYQNTISPDHGFFKYLYPHGYCRFRPTCSDYSIQAIEKHGIIKGTIKASWRILRCNPWNKGGYDPLK
ncbi:MAG: membrane protein insertion efficiency factor YidD [Patescibacteria group bacterium]|jgi:putative membrane protein insertion efficiency factor|nr:membrane protein insertion efficiency factor YidD [Patescibacteria group bacterium]